MTKRNNIELKTNTVRKTAAGFLLVNEEVYWDFHLSYHDRKSYTLKQGLTNHIIETNDDGKWGTKKFASEDDAIEFLRTHDITFHEGKYPTYKRKS